MNEMVEKVGRALADEARFMYERDPERWNDAARAAMEAMREPTKAMMQADAGTSTTNAEMYRAAQWRSMLSAALST